MHFGQYSLFLSAVGMPLSYAQLYIHHSSAVVTNTITGGGFELGPFSCTAHGMLTSRPLSQLRLLTGIPSLNILHFLSVFTHRYIIL